jgi:hypothetical protein
MFDLLPSHQGMQVIVMSVSESRTWDGLVDDTMLLLAHIARITRELQRITIATVNWSEEKMATANTYFKFNIQTAMSYTASSLYIIPARFSTTISCIMYHAMYICICHNLLVGSLVLVLVVVVTLEPAQNSGRYHGVSVTR